MSTTEPIATAILLSLFGALLAVSALFSRASQRFAVPVALVFLGIGMLAGSEGLGGAHGASSGRSGASRRSSARTVRSACCGSQPSAASA